MCFSFRIVSGYVLPPKAERRHAEKPNFTGGIYRRGCNRWGAGDALATSNQRNLISDQIAGGEPVQNYRENWKPCTGIFTSRIHNSTSRVRYKFAAATRCSRLCLFLPARPCPLPRPK